MSIVTLKCTFFGGLQYSLRNIWPVHIIKISTCIDFYVKVIKITFIFNL